MPEKKDLKRLTRARMEKTGESYTTARQRLLEKRETPAPGVVPESQFATLAGMSDVAVAAKTGRTWKEWVAALDAIEAAALPHREIAGYLEVKLGVPGWWAQTVTVGYERIRGLREVGQRRDGAYEANKSRTFAVPVATLYRAFADETLRRRWLPDVEWTVRTANDYSSMRITWPDGTWVSLSFTAKGEGKSTVAVQHARLPSRDEIEARKAYWADRLDDLGGVLATG